MFVIWGICFKRVGIRISAAITVITVRNIMWKVVLVCDTVYVVMHFWFYSFVWLLYTFKVFCVNINNSLEFQSSWLCSFCTHLAGFLDSGSCAYWLKNSADLVPNFYVLVYTIPKNNINIIFRVYLGNCLLEKRVVWSYKWKETEWVKYKRTRETLCLWDSFNIFSVKRIMKELFFLIKTHESA